MINASLAGSGIRILARWASPEVPGGWESATLVVRFGRPSRAAQAKDV